VDLKEIKSCLITGATSGIGKALALELAKQKVPLLLTGRNEDELRQLQEETGGEIFRADLSDAADTVALGEWIDEKNPNLQIHNAGYGLKGPYELLSDEEVVAMIHTNCIALALQTRQAIHRWKQQGEAGVIVNVASVVAHFPYPYSALYAATKAFVRNLSLSIEGEEHPGIKILTSCPGAVVTNFASRAAKGNATSLSKRMGMPVEVAVKAILRQIKTEKREVLFDWKYSLLTRIASNLLPISFLGPLFKKR